MLGNVLAVLVAMDQSLREVGPLRAVPVLSLFRVLMTLENMRSSRQQLWRRDSGQEEKGGGEGLTDRHAGIVTQESVEVKPCPAS
jgi:hypothetical protein